MASLLQRNPLRRREERADAPRPATVPAPGAPPPGAPPGTPPADDEEQRRLRQEEQIRFLREQELRRARTSVPPPGR